MVYSCILVTQTVIIFAPLSKNICYYSGAWDFKNSVFIIWYLILFSTSNDFVLVDIVQSCLHIK